VKLILLPRYETSNPGAKTDLKKYSFTLNSCYERDRPVDAETKKKFYFLPFARWKRLEYSMSIWNLIRPFGTFYVAGNLVYFPPFWNIVSRKIWQPWFKTHCFGRVGVELEVLGVVLFDLRDLLQTLLDQRPDPQDDVGGHHVQGAVPEVSVSLKGYFNE
jgi:hypothetical protein